MARLAPLVCESPPSRGGAPGVSWSQEMNKTPLFQVKERFGSKEKLVQAVEELATDKLWIDRYSEVKGLQSVSNAKLLRLFDLLTDAKERFGTRAKLIDAILELLKRTKDEGLKTRLGRYPVPRLLDLHRAATRRAQRKQPPAAKKKRPRSRKAQAKA
jgi:hypothetical protein